MNDVPLSELCSQVASGGTPSRKDPSFFGGSIPWVKTMDLRDGPVTQTDEKISTLGLKNSSAKMFPPGTVLVAMYGATVGKLGYLLDEAACNQAACALVPDVRRCDPRWLYYVLLSRRSDLVGLASGAAQQNLNVGLIRNFTVSAPSMTVQNAIGEVLGALDDKIAANRRVIEASVRLATQIVGREAVGPDQPLSEIANVQMGSSPRGADLNEDGEGMEFFQGVRDFGKLSPTPRVYATATPRRAESGDTLLAVRAPVGEVNWARNETCIGRGLAALRSADAPVTIHYLLRRFVGRWDEHEGSGTVFSSVTGPQVKAMRFPTVPGSSADQVEQLLSSIHQRALSAEAENTVLGSTRDELLPLLMNGRVTVKDAERSVGDVL